MVVCLNVATVNILHEYRFSMLFLWKRLFTYIRMCIFTTWYKFGLFYKCKCIFIGEWVLQIYYLLVGFIDHQSLLEIITFILIPKSLILQIVLGF
jgi:hypothetical protein